MKKYLHLGYPKNFSTSLQRNFFSKHPDIYHLGIGISSNVGYQDELTSALFEVYLKSAKGFKYAEQHSRLKAHINKHYELALENGNSCFGASSEHFSFGFTSECLDFETKIERAIDLFGKDELNIILIIRNQKSLIRSLYRESVRVGLPMTYSEFVSNLYRFQDRNYLYDLRYDLVYDALLARLPENSIHILVNENLRDDQGHMMMKEERVVLIDNICEKLDIEYLDVDFKHFNRALTDAEIIAKVGLNKNERHDLGREMLFSAEIHRQVNYFKSELDINEPEHVAYEDVLVKRKLLQKAGELSKNSSEKLDYHCDSTIASWLDSFYESGNRRFSEASGISLPQSYYNLDFEAS